MKVLSRTEKRNQLIAPTSVEDAWNEAEIHHQVLAPFDAKRRLYATLLPTEFSLDQVRLAYVRFGRRTFDIDPDGTLAVVAPIIENEMLVNLAAFAWAHESQRKAFRPGHMAVGLEDAILDARLHPQSRLMVFYHVKEWLRHGCIGLLPVDWKATAIFVLQERYDLLATSNAEGACVIDALERASTLPQLFIRKVAA